MYKLIIFASIIFFAHALSYTGILKVGEQGSGKNPLFFSISGSCKVNSGSATLDFKIEKGWAKINGKKYNSGYSGSMSVSAGQTYSGEVAGHAEGWGKNNGPDALNFTCTGDLADALAIMEQGIEITELITETLTIPVGKSATYRNPMFFSVSASCKATTSATDPVKVHDDSGDVSANNEKLSEGQSATINVSNGETLNLHVSGHAEATIENAGTAPLELVCSVSLADDYLAYKLSKIE